MKPSCANCSQVDGCPVMAKCLTGCKSEASRRQVLDGICGAWSPADDCPDIATPENQKDSSSCEVRQDNPTEVRDEKAQ